MYFCRFSSLVVVYMHNVSNGLCVHLLCYLNNLSVFIPVDNLSVFRPSKIDCSKRRIPPGLTDPYGSKQPSVTKK